MVFNYFSSISFDHSLKNLCSKLAPNSFSVASRYGRQQWYWSAHFPLLWCNHRLIAPNEQNQECTARNQTAFLKTWFAKRTSKHSKGVVRRQPSGALSREMNEQINLRTMLFHVNFTKNNTLLLSYLWVELRVMIWRNVCRTYLVARDK